MKAYLDTSSLLKLYHKETGSDRLYEILSDSEEIKAIFLSELAKIEFLSAIWKKIRMNELDTNVGQSVIHCFEEDLKKYHWIGLDSGTINSAWVLMQKYGTDGLRTLDSLQLACALKLKNSHCLFLTSDKLLYKLFVKENLFTAMYD